jgi:hypothetical protein
MRQAKRVTVLFDGEIPVSYGFISCWRPTMISPI